MIYQGYGVALIVSDDGHMHYVYEEGDSAFKFDLLSEVGQPWVPKFEMLMKNRGVMVEHIDDERGCYDSYISRTQVEADLRRARGRAETLELTHREFWLLEGYQDGYRIGLGEEAGNWPSSGDKVAWSAYLQGYQIGNEES